MKSTNGYPKVIIHRLGGPLPQPSRTQSRMRFVLVLLSAALIAAALRPSPLIPRHRATNTIWAVTAP